MKFAACQKGHVIALLSEVHCFKIYLSLYLHRIFKFYFFLFLTFIFSLNYCFGVKKHLSLPFIKNVNLAKFFADVSISQEIQKSDNFSGFCSPEFDNFMILFLTEM